MTLRKLADMRCIGLFEHLDMNMRNYNRAGIDGNQRGHNGNRLVCGAFGKKCGVQVTSNSRHICHKNGDTLI